MSGSNDKILDFSSVFAICCGTVPIDLTTKKALLLHYRPKDEFFFAKGHKDVGESLEAASLRETEEETGYKCTLLPHREETQATQNPSSTHTEPIAVQQRIKDGVRKLIFWFVASGDEMDKSVHQRLEEGEDFEARWVPVQELISILTFEDDKEVAKQALKAAGLEIVFSSL